MPSVPPWDSDELLRAELFSIERLEEHAASLAGAQPVTLSPRRRPPLHDRLADNASVLLADYRGIALAARNGESLTPAAEWLLDNFHVIEAQIQEVREDLPAGFYRQLPKLADGPLAGYPRILGIAWAFVAHTDSHFEAESLRRFVRAYQHVQPLTIGENWALSITVRILLIENLRRAAHRIAAGRAARLEADRIAARLLGADGPAEPHALRDAGEDATPMSAAFIVQLIQRLRDQDPARTPALGYLERRIAAQGTTPEALIRQEHQRQAGSSVTVRNIITSMRLISDTDWSAFFETVSPVDELLRTDTRFGAMDFATRNLYRSAVEDLARGAPLDELAVARAALAAARTAAGTGAPHDDAGYHLIGAGRIAFERALGYRAPLALRPRRLMVRLGVPAYIGAIVLCAAAFLALALAAVADAIGSAAGIAAFALLGLLPAVDAAVACINSAITRGTSATALPGLALREGIPAEFRTLVAIPTLLTTDAEIDAQLNRLEIHCLASPETELHFALLSDWTDAGSEHAPDDARLLGTAVRGIARLNARHPPGAGGARFVLLHRRRRWCAVQRLWMGWERKRGKLHELNRLLRGHGAGSFIGAGDAPPQAPVGVRFVITLDADTRLPRETARRLVGKLAHPLNRPRFDAARGRIVGGYGILQPRVSPSLPVGTEGSLFQRIVSSASGLDPYAAAVSDVYQDLFGEGSYTGKGIYDIDAFEAALAGRVPDGTMLSHDLFEGIFARAGLASDVEVVEEFPARFDVAATRQHRWARGDWQLLPWLCGRGGAMPLIGRWKIGDNLRRTLSAPAACAALLAGWTLPPRPALVWTACIVGAGAISPLLPVAAQILPRRAGVAALGHLRSLASDLGCALRQAGLQVLVLPHDAVLMIDAIVRTLYRVTISHRNLLEWVTAARSTQSDRPGLGGAYLRMAGGILVMAAAALALGHGGHVEWRLAAPFLAGWLACPAISVWISRVTAAAGRLSLDAADADYLRGVARRTWRFFETYVTPADNGLPPDNFQEDPQPVVAHRTSPTNIGLYLLATVSAHDFGWIGTAEALGRMEECFATLARMERYRGHLYNWYDTQDLRPLEPRYVSSVDSGNLAAHLVTLANALREWSEPVPVSAPMPSGAADCRALALQCSDDGEDAGYWLEAGERCALAMRRDRERSPAELQAHLARAAVLCASARQMAAGMDFAFLFDAERRLLSIGYRVNEGTLDPSCYDLLASEARLASFFAIAKNDVPNRHWFRLGRPVTAIGFGAALVSWSGSMFEYLMPSLVMRAPHGSLLEQTSVLVVRRQISYAAAHRVPWGISESAYNARDVDLTYQYSNFGIPGLGLKRGLSANLVIAPYATALAVMVRPADAAHNLRRLAALGALGRHGFHEALDYTPSRLPKGQRYAVVRAFMAHHQGMTILAIANVLMDGIMRRRFHAEPCIQAAELLLQERTPRDVSVAHPRAEEVRSAPPLSSAWTPSGRILHDVPDATPQVNLLSNGRYAVLLTAAGSGYSRWRGLAINRWRADTTRDDTGSYLFLRDAESGRVWSPALQPGGVAPDAYEVSFTEDRAEITRRDGRLTTTLTVVVSPEDDAEVRYLTVSNDGLRPRILEVTSYVELALAPPATDTAHPAFAKLFVQTEYSAALGALLATRRPRQPDEAGIWVAHQAVVEGGGSAAPEYETDRARFIGRGRELCVAPAAMDGGRLSNTLGTVLDPVFALRERVHVAAGSSVRIAFWTSAASTREELLRLVDKHRDANAFVRAGTLSWTQAQVQLTHLGITSAEAGLFQRVAGHLLYPDAALRASSDAIRRGAAPPAALWSQGISGDLPIVLLCIDDIDDLGIARQLLQAHEYWRMKQLAVDLVIVNERESSYLQDLQTALESIVRVSQSRRQIPADVAQGRVVVLRADLVGAATRAALGAVARVVLSARHGDLAEQLERARTRVPPAPRGPARAPAAPVRQPPADGHAEGEGLEYFNGLGGFDASGREYVIRVQPGEATPAPWINVIANSGFGFHVAAEGSAYTWAVNSREHGLTAWSNDPVTNRTGEALYVRDDETGELWGPTAAPVHDPDAVHVVRHGQGYTRFEHESRGIRLELLMFVPRSDPVRIARLRIRNLSGRPRRLSVTGYVEWVLGQSREASAPYVVTDVDATSGALLARNPCSSDYGNRVAFADLGGRQSGWTCDRREFLGRHGTLERPAALERGVALGSRSGAGLDPCAALQARLELAPREWTDVVFLLGECADLGGSQALVAKYRAADLDEALRAVVAYWDGILGTVTVRTPDRAMDIMMNRWLLYQALSCRMLARTAFYQASGAYGFRDQLQDSMALCIAAPSLAREHVVRAAGRQFIEGDVQHWWLPPAGQGVRTRVSDDRAWLAYVTAHYVAVTGDAAVLDEDVPFLDGQALRPDEADAFFLPTGAERTASVYEHCALALDASLALGPHQLPLIGSGDWNDGMNRIGRLGQGESVWLAWFLHAALAGFLPHAERRGDAQRCERWRLHMQQLRSAVDAHAWDGDWYRRGYYDDGTPLGSASSEECRIDSIAQSWSVISGAGSASRPALAMAAVGRILMREEDRLALLFTPPFDRDAHDPGYIKGYPPGIRENGGQYTHAATWSIIAYALLGEADRAASLFAMLNPIAHAATPAGVARYKVEPYVVAADIYSVEPHAGRGGWTWYTGSAAWLYRAALESLLGFQLAGNRLTLRPVIPAGWPGFEIAFRYRTAQYDIRVVHPQHATYTGKAAPLVAEVELDGQALAAGTCDIILADDGRSHRVQVRLACAG